MDSSHQLSLKTRREAIHCSGVPVLEVKDMGGLWVVVTFPSSEQMLSVFDGELGWLNNWFDEVKKWSPTFEEARSRNIWISCYGVPLHCWSADTFNKIARLWGEVLAMDDATVKGLSFAAGKIMIATKKWDRINDIIQIEVKGNIYEIRVVEEQVVIHGHVSVCDLDSSKMDNSKANSVDEANSRRDMEDGGWMKNNAIFKSCSNEVSLVEDSAVLVSKEVLVAEKGACVKVGDNSIQGDDSVTNSIEVDNTCEKEGEFSSQEVDSKSDSTEEGGSEPINEGNFYMEQEPILDANKSGALLDQLKRESLDANNDKDVVDFDQGFWNLSDVGFFKEKDDEGIQLVVDLNPSEVVEDIGKGKWKQKRIEEKLGYPKSKKKGRRKQKKCVVFRSAIAAAALSVSSDGINRIHLNATQAARSISKILDEDYLGDDNEIISSFSVAS